MRLREVIEVWMPEKKRQIKESSFAMYCGICRHDIVPVFGDMEVGEIDKFAVRKFAYRELETKSIKTVKGSLMVLKLLLKYAAEELDQKIPSLEWKIVWPTVNLEKHGISRYTPRQMKTILDYLMENPSNASLGVMIALTTGARIGEVCALRFSDVDFDKNVIHITKTLQRIYMFEGMDTESGRGTKLFEGMPKTRNSGRDVPILPKLRKILKAFAAVARPDYYVASGKTSCCEPRLLRVKYKKMITKAGVSPVLTFHALRHTFASTLIENNIDPKTVSSILGHSDVGITLNLYVHPSDAAKASAINKGLKGLL